MHLFLLYTRLVCCRPFACAGWGACYALRLLHFAAAHEDQLFSTMLPPKVSDPLTRPLADLANGDRSAMRRVYELSSDRLFGIIIRITQDAAAAEDILQETYIKVWNNIASYGPRGAEPMAWLATIARNSAIDWRRAHYQRRYTTSDNFESVEDETENALARIERKQEEAKIETMLGELPKEREAEIRDAFFQGLTYADIARRDSLPLGTIKSRIRRSLIQLKVRLADD